MVQLDSNIIPMYVHQMKKYKHHLVHHSGDSLMYKAMFQTEEGKRKAKVQIKYNILLMYNIYRS